MLKYVTSAFLLSVSQLAVAQVSPVFYGETEPGENVLGTRCEQKKIVQTDPALTCHKGQWIIWSDPNGCSYEEVCEEDGSSCNWEISCSEALPSFAVAELKMLPITKPAEYEFYKIKIIKADDYFSTDDMRGYQVRYLPGSNIPGKLVTIE